MTRVRRPPLRTSLPAEVTRTREVTAQQRSAAADLDTAERSRLPPSLPAPKKPGTLVGPIAPAASPSPYAAALDALQAETFRGVERLLLGKTGLPIDRVRLAPGGSVAERTVATSPSNIGLYLAATVTERDRGRLTAGEARERIVRVLEALEALPRDRRGFFYNWYDADDGRRLPQTGRGLDDRGRLTEATGAGYVSSVDNGNLIITLLGVREALGEDGPLTRAIDALLEPLRENFAEAFLTTTAHATGEGAIRLGYFDTGDGRLRSESHYDRLGSEARSTVAVMEALGALPAGTFSRLGTRASFAETEHGRVFRTWDGGIFQYLLPNVLLDEGTLSRDFAAHHRALADVLFDGNDGLPLAYSASDRPEGGYDGKSGVKALAEDAGEVRQEVLTPHAIFLLASIDPERAGKALLKLEAKFPAARLEEIGFTDAISPASGAVGDTVLSLDQLMSVLGGSAFGRHVQQAVPGLRDVYRSVTLADPIPARASAQARAVLRTSLDPAPFSSTVPESGAIVGRKLELRGRFDHGVITAREDGTAITVGPSAHAGLVLGGERYVELPNSTALTTTDPATGQRRELVLTRGVRPYTNTIDPEAGVFNGPAGYVSDVLLFERVGQGKDARLEYRHTLLRSRPESSFLFEDPRVSTIQVGAERKILLSGTDYAPHVPGSSAPDVMNRFVELELDARGLPLPVEVDPTSGRPDFRDLSPAPVKDAGGTWRFVDAKNATVAQNTRGELVVRSRMRPDFGALPPEQPRWDYGEQVFVFASWDDLTGYDWRNGLDDLFGTAGDEARIRPLEAKVIATERSFSELYPAELLPETPKLGFGPGTAPLMLTRRDDTLWVSEGPGSEAHFAGKFSHILSDQLPIGDGETKFVTFDHDLRVLEDRRFGEPAKKRVYTGTVKLWSEGLDTLELVYAQAMQPRAEHTYRGTGILDLHHTYPMGRVLAGHPEDPARTITRIYAGAADAHTESVELDLVTLLSEMAEGSERRASGQVAPPGAP